MKKGNVGKVASSPAALIWLFFFFFNCNLTANTPSLVPQRNHLFITRQLSP